MSEPSAIRNCKQCDKQLYGRADQVFCNDSCRNTFNKDKNRKSKIPRYSREKEVFAIIRRNYEILKKLCPENIRSNNSHSFNINWIPKDFNQDYFTGIKKTDRGLWHLCFDRGWLFEYDSIILKDFSQRNT